MANMRYERKQGNRGVVPVKPREISFSLTKLDVTQGQSLNLWETEGLLSVLCTRLQQIGQYTAQEALAKQLIKQYTKVGFPDKSAFNPPKHIPPPNYWAVIHITPKSKEVVAGFIDNDIFYIVFLDKEHKFWPTDIQDRGKNKR